MTEDQWLCCNDLVLDIEQWKHLRDSHRKRILLVVACFGKVVSLFDSGEQKTVRRILSLALRIADSNRKKGPKKKLSELENLFRLFHEEIIGYRDLEEAFDGFNRLVQWNEVVSIKRILRKIVSSIGSDASGGLKGSLSASVLARLYQAHLTREIFGNPFRPVAVDPQWLAWEGETVVKIAKRIYTDQAFDRIPVLADAVEDAGCTDTEILNHLRGPGQHVRGCWALDLLLGKQ